MYRGGALGIGFFGRYFFADFGARRLWSVGLTIDPVTKGAQAGQVLEHTSDLGGSNGIGNVSSFGLGADCEVYFLSWSAGELRRIVPAGGGLATGCPTPDPFLAAGGGVFSGGTWLPRNDPRVAGAGLGGSPPASGTGGAGGCTTAQPASDWVCVSGGWVPVRSPAGRIGEWRRRDRRRHGRRHRREPGGRRRHCEQRVHDSAAGVRVVVRQRRVAAARSPPCWRGVRPDGWYRRRRPAGRGHRRSRQRVHDVTAGIELGLREWRLGTPGSRARARWRLLDRMLTNAS